MSYTIDIIDTVDSATVLTLEKAKRETVVLKWHGADEKDALAVVGSSLGFTMVDPTAADGAFDRFFTGNETRFRVELIKDAGSVIIWTGFLRPDSYSEPYKQNLIVASFEATDGLGRLKGKFLTDDFYSQEKSVIQIFTACLAATGLSLPLYFTAAIENSIQKNYHNIYINTIHFLEDDKKIDCYTILEKLLNDMVCCVYQCDNIWYIDALNKRHIPTVVFKHYNTAGAYVTDVNFTRTIKAAKALATPQVTMVAPYGEIFITHDRSQASLPATIAKEANDGWAVTTGVTGEIYATDWNGNGNYYAKAYHPDYKVALSTIFGEDLQDIDYNRFINLRKKIYTSAGDVIRFEMVLTPSNNPLQFQNGTICEITINGSIVKSFIIAFDDEDNSQNFKHEFDIIAPEAGLMDIKIYEPFSFNTYAIFPNPNGPRILKFYIEKLAFEIIPFEKQIVIQDSINDDYTVKKSLALNFSDDATGYSPAFLLQKLDLADVDYNTINVPIIYGSTQLGINYAIVSLTGANLIKDNIDTVYLNGGGLLSGLEVFYNFNRGEEMAIKTTALYSSANSFDVRIYKINDVAEDRTYWQQWTDAVYQIEKVRYIQAVANVYRRMFNVPHYKIDFNLNHSVKFNDILVFPYKQSQNYFISNCSWVIDRAKTTVTAIKGYYQNDTVINPGDNIPPIVEAGDDICLDPGVTVADLLAVASDPDGFIASVEWVQLEGINAATIVTPFTLATQITNLINDAYVFQITVTDNDGATASDTLTICRVATYTFNNAITCTSDKGYGIPGFSYVIRRRIFSLFTTPVLADGLSITVTLRFTAFRIINNSNTDALAWLGFTCNELGTEDNSPNCKISKNNAIIYGLGTSSINTATVDFNMILGDDIKIQIESLVPAGGLNTKCEILKAVDVFGNSIIEGLPIVVYAYDVWTLFLSRPSIVSATAVVANQINLVVNDGNPALTNCYLDIEYSEAGAETWLVHGQTAPEDTTYNVTGLDPDTLYDFRVKAIVVPVTIESEYSFIVTQKTLA